MSSTNKTATIELSQYIGTDKPTYLSDYNGDMLKIDNAIAADRDSISTAQNKADGADGKADANALAIATLDDAINNNTNGLAKRVTDVEGDVNTIESLIGNGEPTTSDKTIIGAINELYGDIHGGGTDPVAASAVSYDNTQSGLTADDVQEAIDEVVAMIPSIPAATSEVQRGTLEATQTSIALTFATQTIGANTLLDVYTDTFGVNPSNVSISGQVVTLTFEAQASDVVVDVKAQN